MKALHQHTEMRLQDIFNLIEEAYNLDKHDEKLASIDAKYQQLIAETKE